MFDATFVRRRSTSGWTWIVALAVGGGAFGGRSSAEAVTTFCCDDPAIELVVWARIVADALLPLLIVPTSQVTIPAVASHPGDASMKSSPAGSESRIVTPVASLGPALLAVSVNVTSSSVPGFVGEALLVSDSCACGVTTRAEASVSSDGLKSGSCGKPPAASVATLAVFGRVAPAAAAVTRAVNDAVTVCP
jgi:hypothetical protein